MSFGDNPIDKGENYNKSFTGKECVDLFGTVSPDKVPIECEKHIPKKEEPAIVNLVRRLTGKATRSHSPESIDKSKTISCETKASDDSSLPKTTTHPDSTKLVERFTDDYY